MEDSGIHSYVVKKSRLKFLEAHLDEISKFSYSTVPHHCLVGFTVGGGESDLPNDFERDAKIAMKHIKDVLPFTLESIQCEYFQYDGTLDKKIIKVRLNLI